MKLSICILPLGPLIVIKYILVEMFPMVIVPLGNKWEDRGFPMFNGHFHL